MIRVWVGSQLPKTNIEPYKACVERQIQLLQKNEKAPSDWEYVNQF